MSPAHPQAVCQAYESFGTAHAHPSCLSWVWAGLEWSCVCREREVPCVAEFLVRYDLRMRPSVGGVS